MRTHVELLLSMADKMHAVLEDRQEITLSMMDEFSYPLARARDFVRIVGQYYGERRSLPAFRQFLDVYAGLLKEIDYLRLANGNLTGFRERLAILRRHGAKVEAILDEEEQR